MKNVIVIVKNNLRDMIVKNTKTFIILTFVPILAILFMSNIFPQNSVGIALVNEDKSHSSKIIQDVVSAIQGYNVQVVDKETAEKGLKKGDVSLIIRMDSNFEEGLMKGSTTGFKIQTGEGNGVVLGLKSILEPHIANFKNSGELAMGDKAKYTKLIKETYDNNKVTIKKYNLNGKADDYMAGKVMLGLVITFLVMRSVMVSARIMEEKREDIYTRIFMAPVAEWQYYLANGISTMVIMFIQGYGSILAMNLIMGIDMGCSLGSLAILILLASIISISIGILMVSICKTSQDLNIISWIISMPILMLGGATIPLEFFPATLEKISFISPVRWVMEMMVDLQQGLSLWEVKGTILACVLFTLFFFLLASFIAKQREKEFYLR